MVRVASVQSVVNPGGPPAIIVSMRDDRRGHLLINQLRAIDKEVCILPDVYCPLATGFTSCPCRVEITGEKYALTSRNARSRNRR